MPYAVIVSNIPVIHTHKHHTFPHSYNHNGQQFLYEQKLSVYRIAIDDNCSAHYFEIAKKMGLKISKNCLIYHKNFLSTLRSVFITKKLIYVLR
jgi:hypothetical protein